MTGAQTFVGAAGLGLVAANFWVGGARHQVSSGLFSSSGDTTGAHRTLVVLGGEALFVVIATMLAGLGGTWASVMAVAVVALWILWAINHYAGSAKPAATGGA